MPKNEIKYEEVCEHPDDPPVAVRLDRQQLEAALVNAIGRLADSARRLERRAIVRADRAGKDDLEALRYRTLGNLDRLEGEILYRVFALLVKSGRATSVRIEPQEEPVLQTLELRVGGHRGKHRSISGQTLESKSAPGEMPE